ncbi:MAG: M1 family aminopeptidase [bacterium]
MRQFQIVLRNLLLALSLGALIFANPVNAASLPYRIVHHELQAELDVENHHFCAGDRVTIQRIVEQPRSFSFLLRKGLLITSIVAANTPLNYEIHPQANPLDFQETADREDSSFYEGAQAVKVLLPKKIAKNDTLVLEILYEGVIIDSIPAGEFSREYVIDQLTGVIDTMGIYLGSEAFYYPTLPKQLFTFAMEIELPESFSGVSEGVLQETTVRDHGCRERWECHHPVDAFHIIAGDYQISTVDYQGIQIGAYFFAEQADLSQKYLEACKGYFDLYNELLGAYPFEKFWVVDNFFASGYGMPSFTLLGSQVLRLPFIIYTSLGHEICHNWWGNSVYVDYESGNWCEGLTVYCADYLYKERKSAEEARAYRLDVNRDYTAYVHEHNDFPLRDFVVRHDPAQRAVGYGKGALVFHMLRRQIGDEQFWGALRRFYRENTWSLASWSDIQCAFVEETSTNLDVFFKQWVNRAGAPLLTLASCTKIPMTEIAETHYRINFKIGQEQSSEPYSLNVPILITGEGQQTWFTVPLNQAEKEYQLEVDFNPVSLSVDPDFDLFRRLHRAEYPPTLADLLGQENLLIVLPGSASPEALSAYEELAFDFSRKNSYRIIRDHEVNEETLESSSVLFLGAPSENAAIPAEWWQTEHWSFAPGSFQLLGQEYLGTEVAFLTVGRAPHQEERTLGFFCGFSPEAIKACGKKLPHYGKYSYLVFQTGKNIAKGVWEVTGSPLTVRF